MLDKLTGKKNIVLTKSGNKAILQALRLAKQLGYRELYLADQGGWITYHQYGKKLKFNIHYLETDLGLIDFKQVKKNSVIIFNAMPAYAFEQTKLPKTRDYLAIADITGSIGSWDVDADILVCSFGENKMINLGTGGMIASNMYLPFEESFEGKERELKKRIIDLPNRLKKLRELRSKVVKEVKALRPDHNGINVISIEYCEKNNLEYKKCPMRIKVNIPAVSIEIQNSS